MSTFIKHTWVTGETITAAQLNRIEQGIKDLFDTEVEMPTDTDLDELFDNYLEDDD